MSLLSLKPVRLAVFFTVLSTLIFSCNENKKNSVNTEPSNLVRVHWSIAAGPLSQIRIVNQFGNAIPQAQILIGDEIDSPFTGNLVTTDASGNAIISEEWTVASPVTVEAAGYVRLTLLNQVPGDMTIRLSPVHLALKPEIRGQVTQLPVINGDKLIDFGLVVPALTRGELLNFDIDQVLSPYSDILTVASQDLAVPTNISLPTQKESYIFGFTISKPDYRMQAANLGPKRFFAARGNFVFKDVVGEIKNGKPFYELINYFSIQGGSLRDVTLTSAVTNLDIPADELEFKNSFTVTTPGANPDEIMIVMAASQLADTMIPTDIKKTTGSQSITLASLRGKPAFVVSVIKRQTEFMSKAQGADRMSASLLPALNASPDKLLPLINNPTITNKNGYVITLPTAPTTTGVYPLAVSAIISQLTEVQNGADKATVALPRWEVLGVGWDKQIQLPKWSLTESSGKMRVGVNFLGSNKRITPVLDDRLIEAATHVSHASADF